MEGTVAWMEQAAQVEVWEKENSQSSQSFAQNLEENIKEAETKLDKLVNAFLDGSIERANGGLWRKIRTKCPQRASIASAYLLPKTLNVQLGRNY